MKRSLMFSLCCWVCFLTACAQQNRVIKPETIAPAELPIAFPGAEGYGRHATGGRGGKILRVTHLGDDGEGSFRAAVTAKGPRIVVFTVSGTIHLLTPLSIKSDITIFGQSAPGDGICIADQPVNLGGNNIIIRYLRFRMGDKFQNKGKVGGSGHDDALSGMKRNQILIDHCSISWSNDECISIYAGDSTTLQWNIISEPLNYSYHFETGDTDFQRHGYGGIWGGRHFSAHHNLFAHCNSRNPRFDGIRNVPEENVDYRNNVIYDWGSNNVYAGEGGKYNIVNNYYKYGPSTSKSVRSRIVNPNKRDPDIPFGKFFVQGNYVDGSEETTKNNWLGIHMGNNGTEEDKKKAVVDQPFPTLAIADQQAIVAYDLVLARAGASFRRDTLDKRIVNDVTNRTGGFIDVQGGFPHGTPYAQTVNAWPALAAIPRPVDLDNDNIPDEWEKNNNLDPKNPADAILFTLDKHYMNLEVYLNSIVNKK